VLPLPPSLNFKQFFHLVFPICISYKQLRLQDNKLIYYSTSQSASWNLMSIKARDKCLTTLSAEVVTTTYSVSISFLISFIRRPFLQPRMLPRNFPGGTNANNKDLNQNRQCPEKYRYRNLPNTNLDRHPCTSFLGVIPWEAGGRRHSTCGAPSNSKFPNV
jgi:hypothetical protein